MTVVEGTGEITLEQLSDQEWADCEALEVVVSKGIKAFVAVGEALAEIRDRRLYRNRFASFETYCEQQWEMSRTHADRLVVAAEVNADLAPIGVDLSKESHARELAPLTPEKRREAAAKANEKDKPTANDYRAAAEEVDPTLEQQRKKQAERDKSAAERQAKEDAAAIAAAQAALEAEDNNIYVRKQNGRVRNAIAALLETDPDETGPYCPDPERRARQLDRVEQWCKDHRAALNAEGASLHVINGGD